ncbi:CU044_5270 family protein [Flindersiella endophytica]
MGERDRELERLRELLPEQPPPSRGSQARARARLLHVAGSSQKRPSRRRTIRLATVGVAAVAVLALLLGPLYLNGMLSRPGGDSQAIDPATSPSAASADDDAKNVLLGAARQVDALRPEPVGAFWHVRSLISVPHSVGTYSVGTYSVESWLIEETWTERGSGHAWSGSCDEGARPRSSSDIAAWKRDGSPEVWKTGDDGPTLARKPGPCRLDRAEPKFALGERLNIDYAAVEAIPADVEDLRAFLLEHRPAEAGEPDQWLFSSASALLVDLPVSPQVRAAAFRLLAGLPDVVSQGVVRDSQGRTGTAIALRDKRSGVDSTLQLVVDPASGKLLSRRLNALSSADGKPVKRVTETYLSVGWTNQKPSQPSRELN